MNRGCQAASMDDAAAATADPTAGSIFPASILPARANATDEAVRLVGEAGREQQRVAALVMVHGREAPQPFERDHLLALVLEPALERAVLQEPVDHAVAEVPDQDRSGEATEVIGTAHDGPGRVESPLAREATDHVAVDVEEIDIAIADARDVILLVVILERERHVQDAVDV